jgi:hypothetical protein
MGDYQAFTRWEMLDHLLKHDDKELDMWGLGRDKILLMRLACEEK